MALQTLGHFSVCLFVWADLSWKLKQMGIIHLGVMQVYCDRTMLHEMFSLNASGPNTCRNYQIVSEYEPVHGNEKKKCLYQVFTRAINYFFTNCARTVAAHRFLQLETNVHF